jgi:glycosyltransferase EpsF
VKPVRVLHVVNWLRLGGAEIQLLRILRRSDRSRFHMDVCVIGSEVGYLSREFEELGAEIIHCPKTPNLLAFSSNFRKAVSGGNYQIVHSHFDTWSGAILRGAAKAGVPVRIAQLHSMKPWPEENRHKLHIRLAQDVVSYWGRRWIVKYATDILAVSRSVMEASRKWNKTVKTSMWNAGIDIDRFYPPESRLASNPRLIWVGGLLKGKRVDMLLNIFQKVARSSPEAGLIVVGTGPQEEALKQQAARMGLNDSIIFLGRRRDIPELLREATVFVTCSEFEGLPTVLLEAQACGAPVVASDIPPHREVLCDDMLPFLFDASDLDDAARKICAIIDDEKLRTALAQAARNHAVNRYNATRQIADLESFYMTSLDSTCKL